MRRNGYVLNTDDLSVCRTINGDVRPLALHLCLGDWGPDRQEPNINADVV